MSKQSPYRISSPAFRDPVRMPPTISDEALVKAYAAGYVEALDIGANDIDIESLHGRKWERTLTSKVRNGKIVRWRPL